MLRRLARRVAAGLAAAATLTVLANYAPGCDNSCRPGDNVVTVNGQQQCENNGGNGARMNPF